jgi:hypothetical protein
MITLKAIIITLPFQAPIIRPVTWDSKNKPIFLQLPTIIIPVRSTQRLPIISEISDKGAYRVELRWSSPLDIQSPTIISEGGFDIEVLFLNASVPEATPQTIPGGQTNLTSVRRVELF